MTCRTFRWGTVPHPALLALATATLAGSIAAQTPVSVPSGTPVVQRILRYLQEENAWTLDRQATLCEIPSPPFGEAARAKAFLEELQALGLRDARIDEEGNVLAVRPGRAGSGSGAPRIVLSAHLDTVFPEGTNVTVHREGTRLTGPGIGDDCRGLAVVLAVARALQAADAATVGTIVFVGTVGEEGAGDLRGARHLIGRRSAGPIDVFLSVDGTGLGTTRSAVGSHRYRVTFSGPGGHSYGAFGMPNPIHALGRAIALLAEVRVPEHPKTTFSVGTITGGTSVNAIAMAASMDVDLRSESQEALDTLDAAFQHAVRRAAEEERARWPRSSVPLAVEVQSIGRRPAGTQADTAFIVRAAVAAARALGFETPLGASSTDANIAISRGIPAVTIDGGGSGDLAHALGEWYDDGAAGFLGPQWAALLVLTLAGVR